MLATRSAWAQGAPDDVRIGILFPLSGANAPVGIDARHALEVAADIINRSFDLDLPGARGAGIASLGGARVRLIFADHQSDPQKGRSEAERLITQDKVCAIIGAGLSSVAATVSVSCERYRVPFIAADTSSPSLQRRKLKFFFRPTAHDGMFSKAMFDFMDAQRASGRKIDTVGILHEDTIFGTDSSNGQRALAEERGYRLAADIKYRANSPSLTTEVQKIKSAAPDVLLPTCYQTDAILLVKSMAQLGYKPKNIIAQASGFAEQVVYDAVGDQLRGLISRASFALDLAGKRPSIGAVNSLFKARSRKDLNDNTSRQFISLLILANAIERAKSVEGTRIREALAATNIPGIQTIMPWTHVQFDQDGQNIGADPILIQYINKRFVTIFPATLAVASAAWPMNA